MGLPQLVVKFLKKSATLITRSGRGLVVLILKDSTKEQVMNPYKGLDEVSTDDWDEKNYEYIKMVFKAEPSKVLVVRGKVADEALDVPGTLQLIKDINADYLVSPCFKAEDGEAVKSFVKKVRDAGKKLKAVLPAYDADYEAIINFPHEKVGVVWDEGEMTTYTGAEYCCRIAGILAAVSLTQSSTYQELPEIVDIDLFEDPDAESDKGKLVVIFDGEKYKIGRGVTSLQTVSEEHPADFMKIKLLEGADLIRYDIRSTFEEEFVGKLNNTYDNKQQLIGAIMQYLKGMEGTVVDAESEYYVELDTAAILEHLKEDGVDTDDLTEQQIKEANTGSVIYLGGAVKLLDAVEDLKLTMRL